MTTLGYFRELRIKGLVKGGSDLPPKRNGRIVGTRTFFYRDHPEVNFVQQFWISIRFLFFFVASFRYRKERVISARSRLGTETIQKNGRKSCYEPVSSNEKSRRESPGGSNNNNNDAVDMSRVRKNSARYHFRTLFSPRLPVEETKKSNVVAGECLFLSHSKVFWVRTASNSPPF